MSTNGLWFKGNLCDSHLELRKSHAKRQSFGNAKTYRILTTNSPAHSINARLCEANTLRAKVNCHSCTSRHKDALKPEELLQSCTIGTCARRYDEAENNVIGINGS